MEGGDERRSQRRSIKQIIEREQPKRSLMKYLRFRLKGSTKKVSDNRGAPSAPFVPGAGGNRGQAATDIRRAHIEHGRVGSAHSCVTALPPQPPAPCFCQPFRGPRTFNFTPARLHSDGFVSATTRRRPIPDRRRCLSIADMYTKVSSPHRSCRPKGGATVPPAPNAYRL